MTLAEYALIFVAALGAGVVNVVAGAGTLITFPTLLAMGVPPVVANVSNTIGLIPASLAGAYGFRRDLIGEWPSVAKMGIWSAIGGIIGGLCLLVLPAENFVIVVPFLLVLSGVLAAAQPRVSRWVRRRSDGDPKDTSRISVGLVIAITATGVYGGYFGAAQGVILLAVIGILWTTNMNRANGAKNVLAGVANVVSAVLFVFSGSVDWKIALIIAAGSGIGGLIGARIGRFLPAPALRAVLVVTALVAAVVLWLS
jgi:uncharacterized protein